MPDEAEGTSVCFCTCVTERQHADTHTVLPTKLCFLLSHSGAALTPFATRAKKAFFTWTTTQASGLLKWAWLRAPEAPPHLQRGVKHHQFGAGRDDVIALVTLHEAHVDVALGSTGTCRTHITLRYGGGAALMSLPVFLWANRSDAKHPGELRPAGNADLSWTEFSI